jgi:hypothetical protein
MQLTRKILGPVSIISGIELMKLYLRPRMELGPLNGLMLDFYMWWNSLRTNQGDAMSLSTLLAKFFPKESQTEARPWVKVSPKPKNWESKIIAINNKLTPYGEALQKQIVYETKLDAFLQDGEGLPVEIKEQEPELKLMLNGKL